MSNITFAYYTDIGDRQRNEDYLSFSTKGGKYLFALADGLGGHGLGDEASKTVCRVALDELEQISNPEKDMFVPVFNSCQDALIKCQHGNNARNQMRTTLNLLYIKNDMAYWSHVGDSRTYYFKDNEIIKRTFDHSVPQMLAAMGEISESQIRFHEDQNRLLRVLGVESQIPVPEVEEPVRLTGGQQFLLCSDGFWELINEEQMLLCLDESDTPHLWLENMLELVRRNGRNVNKDNVTAIAVWIE